MLITYRECGRASAKNAIPSLGEIEGRMAVLEVVAQAALTNALIEGDENVDRALLARIRHAIHSKCSELKLDRNDAEAAVGFAEELIDAAIDAAHLQRQ